jgi:hypothetical protein
MYPQGENILAMREGWARERSLSTNRAARFFDTLQPAVRSRLPIYLETLRSGAEGPSQIGASSP